MAVSPLKDVYDGCLPYVKMKFPNLMDFTNLLQLPQAEIGLIYSEANKHHFIGASDKEQDEYTVFDLDDVYLFSSY